MALPADEEAVLQRVLAAAKYAGLDEGFVRRIAGEAAARFRDQNAAARYARRKLHQAVGAFVTGSLSDAVRACVSAIAAGAPVRDASLAAMRRHASTAERAAVMDAFYRQIEAWCGRPATVADLGCGLSPLAIPWLATSPGATYWCCDVDRGLTGALPALSEPFGVTVVAQAQDLVRPAGLPSAELVLLLKAVTTLEQQRTGAARDVLAALDAPRVVVSLPRASLSARRRYTADPAEVIGSVTADSGYVLAGHATFGDESLYLLARSAR